MSKLDKLIIDKELINKKDLFIKNTNSEMHYVLNHDWIDEIENACPFIDIIVRNPKLTLIKEEQVTTIERAKKITVDSVKDLAKHSNYITDVEKEVIWNQLINAGIKEKDIDDIVFSAAVREYAIRNGYVKQIKNNTSKTKTLKK